MDLKLAWTLLLLALVILDVMAEGNDKWRGRRRKKKNRKKWKNKVKTDLLEGITNQGVTEPHFKGDVDALSEEEVMGLSDGNEEDTDK